ncbi:MAG: hypothetical protein ACYDAG_09825, partial [Chloroflexota bacterium]
MRRVPILAHAWSRFLLRSAMWIFLPPVIAFARRLLSNERHFPGIAEWEEFSKLDSDARSDLRSVLVYLNPNRSGVRAQDAAIRNIIRGNNVVANFFLGHVLAVHAFRHREDGLQLFREYFDWAIKKCGHVRKAGHCAPMLLAWSVGIVYDVMRYPEYLAEYRSMVGRWVREFRGEYELRVGKKYVKHALLLLDDVTRLMDADRDEEAASLFVDAIEQWGDEREDMDFLTDVLFHVAALPLHGVSRRTISPVLDALVHQIEALEGEAEKKIIACLAVLRFRYAYLVDDAILESELLFRSQLCHSVIREEYVRSPADHAFTTVSLFFPRLLEKDSLRDLYRWTIAAMLQAGDMKQWLRWTARKVANHVAGEELFRVPEVELI